MGGVRKVITTNIGTAYTLTLNIDMGTAEGLYIMPRTTNGGNIYTGTNLAQVYVTTSGTHTVTFTASTSTTQLLVEKAGTVTQTFYVDNVKVEQSTPTLNSYPHRYRTSPLVWYIIKTTQSHQVVLAGVLVMCLFWFKIKANLCSRRRSMS